MTWDTVRTRDRRLTGAAVAITRVASSFWRLAVYLRRDVAEATGWRAGDRLAVAYGRGADAGRLRLVRDDANGFALSEHGNRKTTLCVRAPLDRGVVGRQIPSKAARWDFSDGALIVELPDFARPSTDHLAADRAATGRVILCPPAGSGPMPHYDDSHSRAWNGRTMARQRGRGTA